MVVIYHNCFRIESVASEIVDLPHLEGLPVLRGISELATLVSNSTLVVWCDVNYAHQLNLSAIEKFSLSNTSIYSFNPNHQDFFNRVMGYVDLSVAIKISPNKKYATWLMSSKVGVATLEFLKFGLSIVPQNSDFDYFLKSISKLTQSKGVFCYSEPSLLNHNFVEDYNFSIDDVKKTVRFTKQHFKIGWLFILFYSFFIHEKNYSFFSAFLSLFYKRRMFNGKIDKVELKTATQIDVRDACLDVLIPTIGREQYLYDVLCDLRNQTVLPQKVIIIEQNPELNSVSTLDYLTTENWPFKIAHTFTNQTGACNARNIGLTAISSDWIFFADDDIRFASNFIEAALQKMIALNCYAASFSCVSKLKTIDSNINPYQWGGFGAGSSIVHRSSIKDCSFGKGYEFGYGEDGDFGIQIRSNGVDVLFFEQPQLLHLKAPIGGFRTKPIVAWMNESITPKPSPTVMLFRIRNCTVEQNKTYKLKLFLSYYRHQAIKNPLAYYKMFQKQWTVSLKWANELKKINEL